MSKYFKIFYYLRKRKYNMQRLGLRRIKIDHREIRNSAPRSHSLAHSHHRIRIRIRTPPHRGSSTSHNTRSGSHASSHPHPAPPPTTILHPSHAPAQHLRAHARARAPPAAVALALRAAARHGKKLLRARRPRISRSRVIAKLASQRVASASNAASAASARRPMLIFASELAVGASSIDVGRALDAADDTLPRVPGDPSRARVPTLIEEPATDDIVRVPIDEVRVPIEEIRVPIDDATDEIHVPIDDAPAPAEFLVPITPEPLAPAPPKDGGSGDRARPDAVLATLRTDGARSREALLGAARLLALGAARLFALDVFALGAARPLAFALGPPTPELLLLFAADLALEDAEPVVPVLALPVSVLPDAPAVPVLPEAPAVPVLPDAPAVPGAVRVPDEPVPVDAATAAPQLPYTPLTSFAARAKNPRRFVGLASRRVVGGEETKNKAKSQKEILLDLQKKTPEKEGKPRNQKREKKIDKEQKRLTQYPPSLPQRRLPRYAAPPPPSPNPTHTPPNPNPTRPPAHGAAPPPRAVRLELPSHGAPLFVVLVLVFLRRVFPCVRGVASVLFVSVFASALGLAFVLSSESTSAAPSTLTPTPSPALAFRFSPPITVLSILATPPRFLALPSGRIGLGEGTGIADAEPPKTRRSSSARISALGLVRGASVGAILTTMRTIHGERCQTHPVRVYVHARGVEMGVGMVKVSSTGGEAGSAGYRPEVEEDASAGCVILNADAEGGKADMDVEGWKADAGGKADADVECGKADVDGEKAATKPANASSRLLERGRSTVVVGIEAGCVGGASTARRTAAAGTAASVARSHPAYTY
ncbi:hypothetical protein C8J57DRAFT_1586212 [Mycena rebaudengoi]|nr:hypothetical protein C8J57DRAFT_1586212 [Mycena rebaudengoi]